MNNTLSKPLEFLRKTRGVKYTNPEKSDNPNLMNEIKEKGREAVKIVDNFANDLQLKFLDYNLEFNKYWQNSGKLLKYFWIKMRKIGYENHHTLIDVSFDYYSDELIILIAVDLRELGANKIDSAKHLKLLKNTEITEDLVYRSVMKTKNGNIAYKAKTSAELRSMMVGDMHPQIAYCLPKEKVDAMSDEEIFNLVVEKVKEIEKYYLYVIED